MGGIDANDANGTIWTGGEDEGHRDNSRYFHHTNTTDLLDTSIKDPQDVLGFRPTDFRSKQRQTYSLKNGLEEERRLELPKDGKLETPITTWLQQVKTMMTERGMDTVFWIPSDPTAAHATGFRNLLKDWGNISYEEITNYIKEFTVGDSTSAPVRRPWADKYDQENLRLSGIAISESLGPNLYARVISIVPVDSPGPVILKVALNQVMYMNASTIRNLSNELGSLTLKSIPGENVSALTIKITELARELEGSGNAPSDLLNLVSKPYTKGSDDAFKTHALGEHTKVMKGNFKETWQEMVHAHNAFYQDLVQSADYGPAKSGKQDPDEKIQALVAKTVSKQLTKNGSGSGSSQSNSSFSKKTVKCFNCGKEGHCSNKCPNKKKDDTSSNSNKDKNDKDWRSVPPKTSSGEAREKTIDGVTYKWCGKCRRGKGFWNSGDKAHFTNDHRGRPSNNNNNSNGNSSGNETGNVGIVDEPLEFGFFGIIPEAYPKGNSGNR